MKKIKLLMPLGIATLTGTMIPLVSCGCKDNKPLAVVTWSSDSGKPFEPSIPAPVAGDDMTFDDINEMETAYYNAIKQNPKIFAEDIIAHLTVPREKPTSCTNESIQLAWNFTKVSVSINNIGEMIDKPTSCATNEGQYHSNKWIDVSFNITITGDFESYYSNFQTKTVKFTNKTIKLTHSLFFISAVESDGYAPSVTFTPPTPQLNDDLFSKMEIESPDFGYWIIQDMKYGIVFFKDNNRTFTGKEFLEKYDYFMDGELDPESKKEAMADVFTYYGSMEAWSKLATPPQIIPYFQNAVLNVD